jgi:hypothetical protein
LWPRTAIRTAAISYIAGEEAMSRCRSAAIVADAAYEIVSADSRTLTGQFLIDEDVLRSAEVTDFSTYREAGIAEDELLPDFFL